MIRREDVADLRPGDVVEARSERWPGVVVSGPLGDDDGHLLLGPVGCLRCPDGEVAGMAAGVSLTIVSRAPRLYVNHPRTEPVPGDVVRIEDADHPDDSYTNVHLPRHEGDAIPWLSLTHDPGSRYSDEESLPTHLDGYTVRLLVDGSTGEVVP